MSWLLQLMNGLSMAALLFLLASGFTLAFGLMRIVNLAHGGFYLLGGYLGVTAAQATDSFWLGLLAGGLAVTVLGVATERLLLRRVLHNELAQVLLTLGLAYVIGDVALGIWGGGVVSVSPPEWATGSIHLFGLFFYPRYRVLLVLAGAVMALLLWLLQERTAVGMAVRAGVDDRAMASAMGVNINLLFTLVFAFAAFLAGLSGVLGGGFLAIYPGADWEVLVLALVVVIIGGLGSLKGAMIGSLFVGLVDAYGRWLFPELSYAMIMAPMAILLTVRPRGLFGREI